MNLQVFRNRFFILFFLFSFSLVEMTLSSLLLEYFKGMGWNATFAEDSEGYLLVARYFSGESIADDCQPMLRYRLFSPLIPFITSLAGKVLNIFSAFFLINSSLWIGATLLFYFFVLNLLNREELALVSSILFTSSLPIMVWGLPVMVDMGAYFFVALILYLNLKVKSLKGFIALGVITSLALLTKPTLVSLLIFLFFSSVSLGNQKKAFLILGISLILTGTVYLSLGLKFRDIVPYSAPRHQHLIYVMNAFFFSFHLGLFFLPLGYKEFRIQKRFYLLFMLTVLAFYLPFVHNPRLLFIIYPAVIPFISAGVYKFSQRLSFFFKRDERFIFYLIIFLLVLVSNCLTGIYLYITRVLAFRSIEDLVSRGGFLF